MEEEINWQPEYCQIDRFVELILAPNRIKDRWKLKNKIYKIK